MRYKKTVTDWIFDVFIGMFVVFVVAVTLYPLIYIFSMSIIKIKIYIFVEVFGKASRY